MAGPGAFFTRPWGSQPQLDDSPSIPGAAAIWLPGQTRLELLGGGAPSTEATFTNPATLDGFGLKVSATSRRFTKDYLGSATSYGFLIVAYRDNSTAVTQSVVRRDGAYTPLQDFESTLQGRIWPGPVVVDYGAASQYKGRVNAFYSQSTPGGGTFFANGVRKGTFAYPGALIASPGNPLCLGGTESGGEIAAAWTILALVLWKSSPPQNGEEITANPWQLFEPRRIFVPVAAAGGGATATLTGVGITSAAGSLSAAGAAAKTLTGAGTTAAAGTVSASASTNASTTVVGAGAAASAGTLAATGAAAKTLTGATSTASAGAFAATGSATKALTGVGTTASAGTVSATAGGSATATISGVSAASAAGTVTATGAATKTLTGAGATASAGTVSASSGTNAAVTLTGCAVAASVGALSASGSAQIVILGASVTASVGRVSVLEAAAPSTRVFLPPIPLPRSVATEYDRALQQAIKGWADNATRIINDLVSRIP